MRQRPSHQSRLEAFAAGADPLASAAAHSAATVQLIQASGNVVSRIAGMRTQYADVFSSSVVQPEIESIRRLSLLVDDDLYSRICGGNARHNVSGRIAGIAIHNNEFQIESRHLLLQQGMQDRRY